MGKAGLLSRRRDGVFFEGAEESLNPMVPGVRQAPVVTDRCLL